MRLFKRAPEAPKTSDPFREESSIGNVLLRMKKISREQLITALGVQARTNEHLLGALLVEIGAVSALDVARALEIQAKMRSGDRASAEMDLLDAVMAESVECNQALDEAIEHRKANARERGEQTGAFLRLTPKVA
jgi:hypothetical protein